MQTQRGKDALRLAADAREQRKVAQIAEVVALAQAAEEYEISGSMVEEAFRQIAEEASITGRIGTPEVGEWFAMEAAAVLGMSPGAMFLKLRSILGVKYRLPILWQRFLAGELWWHEAADVEEQVASLEVATARRVDELVDIARRTMCWSKVMDRLEYYIALADPEHAQRERDRKAEQRYVYVDTFSEGAATFNGKLDAKDAVDFEAAIASIAKTLPMPDDPNAVLTAHDKTQIRRAAAVGELARSAFGQDVLPQHQLVVHLDATDPALDPENLDGATGAAWVEQWGSLLTEDLPRFLEGSKVTVKPVVDIRQLHAEDRHDPSENLRFAIQQRRASEAFPFGTTVPTACDLDHVQPYRDDGTPGQTNVGNLTPLSRRAHRAKTFGGFSLELPVPGSYIWTTPSGWRFLVDDYGTHLIDKPRPPELREPPPDPWEVHADPPRDVPDEPPPPEAELYAQLPLLVYPTTVDCALPGP